MVGTATTFPSAAACLGSGPVLSNILTFRTDQEAADAAAAEAQRVAKERQDAHDAAMARAAKADADAEATVQALDAARARAAQERAAATASLAPPGSSGLGSDAAPTD